MEVDRRYFEDMVAQHYDGLVRHLTLILHDHEEAQDVAQETYWRAYRAWDRFEGGDARPWLHTIGIRLAWNELRRRRVRRGRSSQPEPVVWQPNEHLDLWNALGGLRAEHRTALVMNVLGGYTQAEIAWLLQQPPGTVGSWIASAKRDLRIHLNEGGFSARRT